MKLPPAPWYVDPDYRPGMEWNNHILSADSNTVCFMAHNPDDNELHENAAHVIASAPAMREALEQIAALSVYAGIGSRLAQAGSIARGALYKAEDTLRAQERTAPVTTQAASIEKTKLSPEQTNQSGKGE